MSADEREFEQQLRNHLSAELNPQLGRASRAFDAAMRQSRQRRQRWFTFASGISLAAALLAIAMGLWWSQPWAAKPRPPLVERTTPVPVIEPRNVEQLVAWQTIDEGVENIRLEDDAIPVRRLRQEGIEQVEWFDPQDKSTIRLMVPREQVILIAQERY